MPITRRRFVYSIGAAAGAGSMSVASAMSTPRRQDAVRPAVGRVENQPPRKGPVVIASANGVEACNLAASKMREGASPVDAAVAGVALVENDPNDQSVGYGGLPNERGVVQLDACVMDGPTHKAGGVAAIETIKNPAQVALLVMRRTDHVLIVGKGAKEFALAHGFKSEDLLTEESRKVWLRWKESLSTEDDWLSPEERAGEGTAASWRDWLEAGGHYGTINCCALDANGDLGGCTTTSGLAFKIPGRVGDSPIIGAGLYVDNEVGAAGSTGRGEANLQNCASFMVVEYMRQGLGPTEAALAVLKRIADRTEPRLRNERGEPSYGLSFYALAKDGRVGGATMRGGGRMAYYDGTEARRIELPALFV